MQKKRKHIHRKKIVVLMGAGAATAWDGISSKDIKKKLKEDKTYMYNGTTTVGQAIFYKLVKLYRRNCANFETFLAVIEEIYNYIISQTNTGKTSIGKIDQNNTSFTPAIFNLKKSIAKFVHQQAAKMVSMSAITDIKTAKRVYMGEMFYYYIGQIIKAVGCYNDNVLDEKYDAINKNLFQFTKYFLNRGYSIKFYTTNYDNIVPQVLSARFSKIKIDEGLRPIDYNKKRFDLDLSSFCNARLTHFNLHGSIFLDRDSPDNRIIHNEYASYPDHAIKMDGGNPAQPLIFTPIITGYNKTQRISSPPFNIGFSAFTNDCNSCSAVAVIGHSLSDPHINSILSTFVSWGRTKFIYITKEMPTPHQKDRIEYITKCPATNIKFIKEFENFLQDKSNWKFLL